MTVTTTTTASALHIFIVSCFHLLIGQHLAHCQPGRVARGVVYSLLGVFLIVAAWQFNPEKAMGFGDVMLELLFRPFGRVMLGAVAAGLVIYGVYAISLARYRRILEDAGSRA